MTDYLGQKLEKGDVIIIAEAHGRNAGASLATGVITSFTPKNVKFKPINKRALPDIEPTSSLECLKCNFKVVLYNPLAERIQ